MRKPAIAFLLVFFLALSISDLNAATLAGVTLPDTVQADGHTLVLNGMGIRKKFVVKVYVAGLYLKQKSSEPAAILKEDAPKRLVMHFVHDVSKQQLADGFEDSFKNNAPDAAKTVSADIQRFLGALEDMKDGEEMAFTYLPGPGVTLSIRGKDKLTIAAPAFAQALFSVWLGPKPPNADLKKGLLGQQ